jgi:hypothetical protein
MKCWYIFVRKQVYVRLLILVSLDFILPFFNTRSEFYIAVAE